MTGEVRMIAVEEDGDEILTPIPTFCHGWPTPHEPARIVPMNGFMRCEYCKVGYGRDESQSTRKGST